ncbi:MAG: transaldolase [Endozoicomonadaceae bacterium]|nr:transaldolase [Endozoicomonadaceae bacterium]
MPTQLEQLKQYSTLVADTGDIEAIEQYQPLDATTNPSLILKASQLPIYESLLKQSIEWAKTHRTHHVVTAACDWLSVQIGIKILEKIKGYISTEIDVRLSFDTQATIKRAHELIDLYHTAGIPIHRILIKIAATWEGIAAAKMLEKEGIQCNLTLLFSMEQAQVCAEAGVFLISPFVGRITDWHKKNQGVDHFSAATDPGVLSVQNIYHYYKSSGYQTIVMAASFRNIEQITALAGCDKLTISPQLLAELDQKNTLVLEQLNPETPYSSGSKATLNEATFRWAFNENAMAHEKLSEGIRLFARDTKKLENQFNTLLTH